MTRSVIHPHRTAVTRALLLKEWRENRAAVIAGVAIFIGLPAFCTGAFALYARPTEILGGFATVTLTAAGWFYAAVLGAQMVCRDFGRREGHFLLARPAPVGQIVRAKLLVGFGHVGGLVLLVWLLERLLELLAGPARQYSVAWNLPFAVGLTTTCVCMFLLAFAAAALTRQALSAVMLATLVLVVFAVAPFVSGRLTDMFVFPARWQSWLWGQHPQITDMPAADEGRIGGTANIEAAHVRALTSTIAAILIVGSAVLAYACAVLAARWSRVPKLGTKSIAWGVALVMVLMFALALREVGSTLPVRSAYWFAGERYGDAPGGIALRDHHLAVIEGYAAHGPAVALFDVSPAGAVTVPRYAAPPADTPDAHTVSHSLLAFDDRARLYVLTTARGSALDRAQIVDGEPVVKHCRLWRIDWDSGSARLAGELAIPDAVDAADDLKPFAITCQDGYLYVLFVYGRRLDDTHATDNEPHTVLLTAYRLSEASPPRLDSSRGRGRITYGSEYNAAATVCFARGADGHTYVQGYYGRVIDATQPDLPVGAFWCGTDSRWYSADAGVVVEPGIVAQSPAWGFAVLAVTTSVTTDDSAVAARWRELGRVPPTLLSITGRSYGAHMLAPRRGQVWEIFGDRAIGYDVSVPTHPRRIAQVNTYRIERAVADGDLLVLDHGAGFSIVRLPQ